MRLFQLPVLLPLLYLRNMATACRIRPIGLLVTDFDETISQQDSISSLAKTAYKVREARNTTQVSSIPPWSYFEEAYGEDYTKYSAKLPPQPTQNGTLEQLYYFLDALKEVELRSLARVSKGLALSGVTREELRRGGSELMLRPHSLEFLKKYAKHSERELHVLSVNWSKDWIAGALKSISEGELSIIANDLEFDKTGTSTGNILPSVVVAGDKLRAFKKLHKPEGTASMYIGDSSTDLECLLEADYGIVVGNNTSLRKKLQVYDIELKPLSQAREYHQSKVVYSIEDWSELMVTIR
ncbi:hypothetical protein K7432_004291 [Basidiobolus ranarum]|uniref:Haloacid dehalogenase-like hydrolase n=1 Tax=Basidiobolus ranarum TaxID=34480 RepID=A0ABR2W5C7_9FUNG